MDLTKEEIRKAILELEDNEEWNEDLFDKENPFPFLSKEARKNYLEYLNRKYYFEVKEEGEWFQLSVKKGIETKELILSTDNLSLKIRNYYGMEIENFSYKAGKMPELPEDIPKLLYSSDILYIENENYILSNNNNIGLISLYQKSENGVRKSVFKFEIEYIDKVERFEIVSIGDKNKTDEEVVGYFEIVLEMFKVLHKYVKEEDADNALKSFGRIISAKIKELKIK